MATRTSTRPDCTQHQRRDAQGHRPRRIDVTDRHEHQHRKRAQQHGVGHLWQPPHIEVERDDVPVGRKSGEEVIARRDLRLHLTEAVSAGQQDERPDRESRAGGQQAGPHHQQHRHEHVGEVVHDVVQPRAVVAGQPLLHPKAASQPPVGGVDERRQREQQEDVAKTTVEHRQGRRQREDRTQGGVQMGHPGHRRERYSRRSALGKFSHTGTPQKCVPSVHRGATMRFRSTQGGPRNFPSCGWTACTCEISSMDAR